METHKEPNLLLDRARAYIWDAYEKANTHDRLMRFLVNTPLHAEYKQEILRVTHIPGWVPFISVQHLYLMVLLHKLGLRGGMRVE
jgi:hypothetical protein